MLAGYPPKVRRPGNRPTPCNFQFPSFIFDLLTSPLSNEHAGVVATPRGRGFPLTVQGRFICVRCRGILRLLVAEYRTFAQSLEVMVAFGQHR